MIDSIIGLILLFVGLPALASFIEIRNLRSRIKAYNKTHPNDLKDVKKTTPASINKQFLDWEISMFAKCPNGYSLFEQYERDWEVLKDEEETD